ncbi:MAG: hypothetical protein ACK526_06465 [Planctomyces sp.]
MDTDTLTAYHEAGHAFAAIYLGARVQRVSIDPDRDDGPNRYGETVVAWNPRRMTGPQMAEKSAIVAIAGPVAEMIYREEPFHPAFVAEWQNDWALGLEALKELPRLKSPRLRVAHLENAVADLYQVFRRDDYWEVIAAIADELLAHEILDEEMFREAVEPWLDAG